MKKSILAVALMLGLCAGAGSLAAAERDGLLTTSPVVGSMVLASASDYSAAVIDDEATTVDKKAKKGKKKSKKSKKSKSSRRGASQDGAGAGAAGQWEGGSPQ